MTTVTAVKSLKNETIWENKVDTCTNTSFSCEFWTNQRHQMKNASLSVCARVCVCGRVDKRYLLAVAGSEIYLAVSLPPALLCYDTPNIWSALYVLKHPVFYRKKLPIKKEGSCAWGLVRKALWLQGCQFDSPDHLGISEMWEVNEKRFSLPSSSNDPVAIPW